MKGWIRLWRQLRENQLWREHRRFSKAEAWIDLLMDTAYADHDAVLGNSVVHVKRGQALISQRTKAAHWLWARNTVHSFLSLLAKLEMLSHEVSRGPDGGYTLLTILNYDKYQNPADLVEEDALSHDQSHALSHDRATIEPRLEQSEEGEEGKEGIRREKKASSASGLPLAEYLKSLPPEGQEVLRQSVKAIASTRKNGKVAQSVLDAFASKVNRYPVQAVLSACQIYLAKNYAGEGKREPYLLAIVKGEAQRMKGNGRKPSGPIVGQEGVSPAPHAPAPKTHGQILIDRAQAAMRAEQEHTQ